MTIGLDEDSLNNERSKGATFSLHLGSLPPAEKRGYDLYVRERVLRIDMHKSFDVLPMADAWAARLVAAATGPFDRVIIDVHHFVTLSSTVLAGLIHLRDFYLKQSDDGLWILGASKRTKNTMEMMKIISLFQFEEERAAATSWP